MQLVPVIGSVRREYHEIYCFRAGLFDVENNQGASRSNDRSFYANKKKLQDSIEDINRFAKIAKAFRTYPNDHNLTKDESAAIYIYTMEMSDNSNIYQILNQILRLEDRLKVRPLFGYLKLLESATSKLPNFKGIVWRGIGKDVTKSCKKD
ncbi:unnamed protein product [Adineta steineri]|uniref:Uncharacterized protein n=1 Tax=Adineta steineri TaxID=433720 RepID=A0A819YY74_9BILA|nr:unnamed protein product [Adineta steineri]CAF4171846.1 unnamed protein product [Adineta steineri]